MNCAEAQDLLIDLALSGPESIACLRGTLYWMSPGFNGRKQMQLGKFY